MESGAISGIWAKQIIRANLTFFSKQEDGAGIKEALSNVLPRPITKISHSFRQAADWVKENKKTYKRGCPFFGTASAFTPD